MTRYHVIDRQTGAKLGDYGLRCAALERASKLRGDEAPESGEARYYVRTVEIAERTGPLFPDMPTCEPLPATMPWGPAYWSSNAKK